MCLTRERLLFIIQYIMHNTEQLGSLQMLFGVCGSSSGPDHVMWCISFV